MKPQTDQACVNFITLMPPSWTLLLTLTLVRNMHTVPVACWRSFCGGLAALLLFLLTGSLGWCPSTALSSSPPVTTCLLVPPPRSSDCAERWSKPCSDHTLLPLPFSMWKHVLFFCRWLTSPSLPWRPWQRARSAGCWLLAGEDPYRSPAPSRCVTADMDCWSEGYFKMKEKEEGKKPLLAVAIVLLHWHHSEPHVVLKPDQVIRSQQFSACDSIHCQNLFKVTCETAVFLCHHSRV